MTGGPYDDIIDLPHHESPKHPRMSAINRAAQFSPFAALTGYGDAIVETARLTDVRVELDEDRKSALNEKLRMMAGSIGEHPEVTITYFVSDTKKAGGSYVTTAGKVQKIEEYERLVVMADGARIPIEEIIEIDGEFFGDNGGLGDE